MPDSENQPQEVKLDSSFSTVQIKKQKLYLLLGIGSLLLVGSLVGSYVLGKASVQSGSDTQLEKIPKVATKSAEPSGVIKGRFGEEIEALNGIAITVEETKIDPVYEQQKQEQKEYYEKNASASAFLYYTNDYFNQSLLNVKVALRNKKTTALTYSPATFRLKDSSDNQYTAGFEGERPQLFGLNPNEVTRITITYIIPSSEKEFKLVYENAEVSFTLP